MTRLITSALAALALAGLAVPAALAETKTVSVAVSYADLNLASPAGAKSMLARLKKASRKICGSPVSRSPQQYGMVQDCVHQTMAGAVNSMNAPIVTAMFTGSDRYVFASR